jgi:predicted transcriptional regulator
MIHPFKAALTIEIEDEMRQLTTDLAKNKIRSMEDYKYLVGIIRGLEVSRAIIESKFQTYVDDK